MKKKFISIVGLMVFLTVISASSGLYAQGAPGDGEVRERLIYINTSLSEGQFNANLWYWGWLSGYTAAATVQLSLYFYPDKLNKKHPNYARQDMMAGFITTMLGIGGLAIDPMVPGYALCKYRDMPENTPEERLAKLKQAEYWLKKSAKRERDGRGWLNHVLNFAVNFTAGMVIWLGFDRPWYDFFITFGPGFAIGEAQIFTQPWRAIDDWQAYQRKYMMASMPRRDISKGWYMAAYPGGFVAGMYF